MNIAQATKDYEHWMRGCAPIADSQLRDKHSRMKQNPFQFFRGSYYRWAQLWPDVCAKSKRAPVVLSVGDLHVDSFGTWRDAEGRLCWGVDDFDEAWPLPYTNDLIRLAASVKIAREIGVLSIRMKSACDVILEAYQRTLREGGFPIVLAEEETHLERLGIGVIKPPESFWKKLSECPAFRGQLPRGAKNAFKKASPIANLKYKVIQREAGLGSLGQLRLVAIACYRGGYIAREAKALVPSASMWLNGQTSHRQPYYEQAMKSALRSPDPYQTIVGSWLIRRLSPDSNPIKIEELSKKRDEEALLRAMGMETANVHLGNKRGASAILRDLRRRKPDWLHSDAKKMAKVCLKDWKEYKD